MATKEHSRIGSAVRAALAAMFGRRSNGFVASAPQASNVTPLRQMTRAPRTSNAPILSSEKDGRLYAIAMLEALDEAGDENPGADAEGESMDSEGDKLTMNIYRTAPQATPARKWIEELYQYGTPDAIAGFYVVVSHFFACSTHGTPSLEHFSKMEDAGKWPQAGSVIYRDPKAAAAAIAAGRDQYEVTMTPAEIEQRAERKRQSEASLEEYIEETRELERKNGLVVIQRDKPRTQTPAEDKAAEHLGRTFSSFYALDDIARRMAKTPLSFWTTYHAVKGIAADIRGELEQAAAQLQKRHKAGKIIADALLLAEAIRESLLNVDDGSGEWNTHKATVGAGMLAMVHGLGRCVERAEIACGGTPTGGYLGGDDLDPAQEQA